LERLVFSFESDTYFDNHNPSPLTSFQFHVLNKFIQLNVPSEVKNMTRRDKVCLKEVITGAILLIILLSSLKGAKLPSGVKHLEINNVGLPQSAVDRLKDILKP
jgi:hypothetical protein